MKYIKDGLFGLAVGEAFSVQHDMEERNIRFEDLEMQGYRAYDAPKGSYSDDTCEVLACMDSYLKTRKKSNNLFYPTFMDNLCNWVNNNDYACVDYLFDISKSTRFALMNYWRDKDLETSGLTEDNRQDGSFLARLFVLLIMYKDVEMDDLSLRDNIIKIVKPTHNNEVSFMGGFIYYKLLKYLVDGDTPEEAYEKIRKIQYNKMFSEETINKYSRLIENDILDLLVKDINGDNSVVSMLESVIYILCIAVNYQYSIKGSVSLGDATGMRGSLVGLPAGIYYGYKSIPKEWLNDLRNKAYLEKWIRKIRRS